MSGRRACTTRSIGRWSRARRTRPWPSSSLPLPASRRPRRCFRKTSLMGRCTARRWRCCRRRYRSSCQPPRPTWLKRKPWMRSSGSTTARSWNNASTPGRLARHRTASSPWTDRSHAPAWERRQGRSAFRFWRVTQSVTGCIPTQSMGTINASSPQGSGQPLPELFLAVIHEQLGRFGQVGAFEPTRHQGRTGHVLGDVDAHQVLPIVGAGGVRAGHQHGKTERLADHATDHLDGRRAEDNVGRQAQLLEDAHEIGPAGLYVQQDHRFQRQVPQRDLGLIGEAMPSRQ
ncbi:Hypothetical protein PSEBR_m886 [Pseudomonas brassicacearum subsp. brassicacearum NFM421]|uniref:Uncharacterized protein n=1 Tax=Pseudomonas brassicacearum (strain NFM421) TaxID=994484 RepID=F2KA80_PSEBN|nr:Hypothetical protein PSEBR_m886 [Pseudomonas brassicacearum subsp. brassicacearum NFM421]